MRFLVSVLLIAVSLNLFASDENLNCSKSVLVDKTNSLDLKSVANSTNFNEVVNEKMTFGFTPFKYWIKILCTNTSDENFSGKYQFLYPVIDILNIYNLNFEKIASLDFRNRVLSNNNISVLPEFDINVRAHDTFQFFVEAQSQGSLQLQSQITAQNEISKNLISPSFFYGLFFGALLALMLYNLFFGISLKDLTYFYYCGYVIFFFLYQITITGYGPIFFGKSAYFISNYRAAWLHSLFFFITIFARRFLLLDQNSPKLSKLLKFLSLVYGLTALLTPFLPTQGNLEFSAITSIIVPLILIIVASKVLKQGFKPARFFVIAWVLFLSAIVVTAMRNIGLLPKVWWVDHILEFGILGEVFLISLGLAFKMRLLEWEKNQAATDVINERLKVVELNSQLEKEKLSSIISAQVSHDIRSPISALNMVVGQLQNIPEQHRLLIRHSVNRINDIANSLLEKGKQKDTVLNGSSDASLNLKVEMLGSMIDVLVSEKRTQFRNKPNVDIEAKLKNSYGVFIKVNSTELKRVLSNLITNAVEALDDRPGLIQISVVQDSNQNVILIEDNGKGIPESVLVKLGERGVSHGKNGTESGSGLGVYHAKKTIESFGGQFKIESKVGVGTTITMTFPSEEPPDWFVSSIKISLGHTVVITDDDSSIHGLWTERLKALNAPVQELHFSSDEALSTWYQNRDLSQSYLFLMDYELLGSKKNGLDLIENLKLNSDAVLVTSRYDEQNVRERCKKNGVKLIPKGMSEFIPIIIEQPKVRPDAVLIDDDPLMKLSWEFAAKEIGASIRVFESHAAFLHGSNDLDLSTPIYVDVNLGNGVKGTDVAVKLSRIGFKELYLATGYDASMVENVPNCILEVRGKEPIFTNRNI